MTGSRQASRASRGPTTRVKQVPAPIPISDARTSCSDCYPVPESQYWRFFNPISELLSRSPRKFRTEATAFATSNGYTPADGARQAISSRNPVKRAFDRFRKVEANEVGAGVQILIDHAKQVMLLREIVLDNGIELSQFEGGRIVIVADAYGEPVGHDVAGLSRRSTAATGSPAVTSRRRPAS